MWSLILLDCQISVTAGSYIQIYISLPLCRCLTPPPIILLLCAQPTDEWIHALMCFCVCVLVWVYVWWSHSSSPLHGSKPVDVSLHSHVTSTESVASVSAARFVTGSETLQVKHTHGLSLCCFSTEQLIMLTSSMKQNTCLFKYLID